MRLLLVEPTIPIFHRKALVDARVVFSVLDRLRRFLVGLVVRCAGKHFAHKENLLSIGTPQRRPRPGRQRSHPLRLPAAHHVEHVDLGDVVPVALRRKRHACRIRTPLRPALRRLGLRELPRRRTAVDRHEPQIRRRVLRFVSRLRHGKHGPLSVRTRHRRADAFHQPKVLMRDRPFGGLCGRQSDRDQTQNDERPDSKFHPPASTARAPQASSGSRKAPHPTAGR